jgi:hypothetical protein
MVRISRNNLSEELKTELNRLGSIGDLIGGCAAYANLPTTNTDVTGNGLTIIGTTTQIKSHDLIIVSDATGANKGRNAIFEAATSDTAGGAVTWTYVMNMVVPIPIRNNVLKSNVVTVLGSGNPALTTGTYSIWNANRAMVEVYINGLSETGFTITTAEKLQLTGYTASGWTTSDVVEVFAWKET